MADIQPISGILATLHNLTVETYVPVAESDGTGDFVTKKFDIRNVDNVREYNNKTDFPTVGRAKTIYIDKTNGQIYSWDGNQYLLLSVRIVDGVVSPDSTWSSEKINTTFATADDLTSHTTDTNNPHNVTAAQLGAANILTQIKTVDGAGSGLDADLLDGNDSSYYAPAVHTHTVDDITDLNRTHYINIILDAGGEIIETGFMGDFVAPACTITEAILLAATAGSIEIELWKDTYDNFPPTSADKITATSPPKLVSAIKSKDTNLTGWTTSINQGDIIRVVVNSCEGISQCTLSLKVTV